VHLSAHNSVEIIEIPRCHWFLATPGKKSIWLVAQADRQVMAALLSAVAAIESGCQQRCQRGKN
jgi:hypothetical protein